MKNNGDVKISRKKPSFKISKKLDSYLKSYKRVQKIPIEYSDLLRYVGSVKVTDDKDASLSSVTLTDPTYLNKSEYSIGIFWTLLYDLR